MRNPGQEHRAIHDLLESVDAALVELVSAPDDLSAVQDAVDALTEALLGIRARGGIVIVVAHRPSALAGLDQLLVLAGGKQMNFGSKDEILSSFMKTPGGPRVPTLRPVRSAAGGGES